MQLNCNRNSAPQLGDDIVKVNYYLFLVILFMLNDKTIIKFLSDVIIFS